MQTKSLLSRVFIFMGLMATTSLLDAQTLSQHLDALIEQTLPHAHVGVLIQDAESGQLIYQYNADKSLALASNVKLFTAAAALYQLGPHYRYTTSLLQKNNDFYLQFTGAPDLTTAQLKQLFSKLTQQGLQNIKGNLVIDASRFQPPYHAPGVSYDDLGWYYEAPSSAVMLNGNAEEYEFTTAKQLGMPVQLKPALPGRHALNLINNIMTVSPAEEKEHCNLSIEQKRNNTLRLYGCLPQTEQPIFMKLAVSNPILLAKQVIGDILLEEHIVLNGQIIEATTPTDAKIRAILPSDDLSTLITHMLQMSDNLYADSLTKLLGFELTGTGNYKQGVFAIKKILSEHTPLDMKQLILFDGMGARYNYTTPSQMALLLSTLYHDKAHYAVWLDAFPRMGRSGSLHDRMKKSLLENQVMAKTGTMHDISALSGYLLLSHHKTLIFSLLLNDVTDGIQTAKDLEDKILLTVFTTLNEAT